MKLMSAWLLSCLPVLIPGSVFSQDTIMTRNRIDINPFLTVSQQDSMYSYDYLVANSDTSHQSVWQFWLILPTSVIVSDLRSPLGWKGNVGLVGGYQQVRWGTGGPYDIQPGASIGGYSIKCNARPGVLQYYAEGWAEPPLFEAGEATDSIPGYSDLTPYGPGIVGMLVGPVSILANQRPIDLTDSLLSYVTQSRTYKWILSQSVKEKYTGYFSRVRNDLLLPDTRPALSRLDTVLEQVNLDSSSTLTSEAYALIRFNTEYLKQQLLPSHEVKGAIFSPDGTSFTVKAKPDSNFTSADTLIGATVTVRWQSKFPLTLGTVTSSFGFAKYGSDTTIGSYKYQKFRTTTHTSLNWTANTEYDLFTVAVTGNTGAEDYELTNALAGGEWFVDINYLDKTDSAFYASSAHGFAWSTKSDNSGATFGGVPRWLDRF